MCVNCIDFLSNLKSIFFKILIGYYLRLYFFISKIKFLIIKYFIKILFQRNTFKIAQIIICVILKIKYAKIIEKNKCLLI